MFAPASHRELAELASQSTLQPFRKGHIFYRPEDRSQTVYILTTGRVVLYRLNPEGKRLTLDVLSAGALFDDLALLNDNIRIGQGHTGERLREEPRDAAPSRTFFAPADKTPLVDRHSTDEKLIGSS